MKCIDCGERRVVMLTESIVINRRRVTWNVCMRCYLLERKR